MTTIAFASGIMAADSFASDDCTVMEVVKCASIPGGNVAGGSGDLGLVTVALEWLKAGCKGDAPDIEGCSILYTVAGVLHIAAGKWPGAQCRGNAAIGSGSQGALVAMRMGKTAEQAVRAVIGVDPYTGGHVEVLPVTWKAKAKRK